MEGKEQQINHEALYALCCQADAAASVEDMAAQDEEPDYTSEECLALDIGGFYNDPLGFVLYIFPWGEGVLKEYDGPDRWQREVLEAIGDGSLNPDSAIRMAVASGHGIGKTALVAWIILWAMSTRPGLAGVVTANTARQLETKTWRELALWHNRAINRHWFNWSASKFCQVDHPETWFIAATPWNREKSEAFAGLHAEHVLVIYDEASAIDDLIWEVTEGAMTTSGAIWCVFGNPTRNSGAFHNCFGSMRHRWHTLQVDSREAKMANRKQIAEWITDYGEDSDFIRMRVRGVFPRSGSNQLISQDLIEEAQQRLIQPGHYAHAPKVIGVDVARFGEDQSAISLRQGLALHKLRKFRGIDTMTLAGIVAEEIELERPDAVFVDAGGLGAGVVDRLHQLGFRMVVGIDFGGSASNPAQYLNKRTEMWCLLRDWLKKGGTLLSDQELASDLAAPEYSFTGDRGQIALEKKRDLKKRGLASPDLADSLALTFAQPVSRQQATRLLQARTDYDVIGYGIYNNG